MSWSHLLWAVGGGVVGVVVYALVRISMRVDEIAEHLRQHPRRDTAAGGSHARREH